MFCICTWHSILWCHLWRNRYVGPSSSNHSFVSVIVKMDRFYSQNIPLYFSFTIIPRRYQKKCIDFYEINLGLHLSISNLHYHLWRLSPKQILQARKYMRKLKAVTPVMASLRPLRSERNPLRKSTWLCSRKILNAVLKQLNGWKTILSPFSWVKLPFNVSRLSTDRFFKISAMTGENKYRNHFTSTFISRMKKRTILNRISI